MAIIECKECKHQVSSTAKTCPNCGAKVANNIGCLGMLGLGVVTLFVFSLLGKPPDKVNNTPDTFQQASEEAQAEPAPSPNTWSYSESKDQMANGIIKSASVNSNNKINLDFPYSGGTNGYINVRKHPRWGTDVIIGISKGQLLCSYNNCTITARFDDSKSKRYSASEPSDHSSEMLFINDTKGFIANLKNAKKTYVEVSFYQNGNFSFEFNTENLTF